MGPILVLEAGPGLVLDAGPGLVFEAGPGLVLEAGPGLVLEAGPGLMLMIEGFLTSSSSSSLLCTVCTSVSESESEESILSADFGLFFLENKLVDTLVLGLRDEFDWGFFLVELVGFFFGEIAKIKLYI